MVEKRKEYDVGEIINCPKCGGGDIDCDAPENSKCRGCGTEFSLKTVTVAVWEE